MFVLCVGMWRSCSTWQYLVASHLVVEHCSGVKLGRVKGRRFAAHQRRLDPDQWYVLKNHDGHDSFARALASGQARALYSYRDLRDVTYSLIHLCKSSFEHEVVVRQMVRRCVANDRYWLAQPGVLCQRFEDLIADPVAGVRQIADHLELALADGEADKIAAEYSFKSVQRRTQQFTEQLRAQGIDPSAPSSKIFYAKQDGMPLAWNHVREGRAGGWQVQSTPVERVILDAHCGDWLIERGYERDHAWAQASADELTQALVAKWDELAALRERLRLYDHLGPAGLGAANLARRLRRLPQRIRNTFYLFGFKGRARRPGVSTPAGA